MAVWAKSAALAIGVIAVAKPGAPGASVPFTVRAGIVTAGTFTSLPVTLTQAADYQAPGGIAF
jgi:hypothetical protein